LTTEECGWLRLHLTPGLGRAGLFRLVEAFGSLEAILEAPPTAWIAKAGIREKVARNRLPADSPVLAEKAGHLERLGVSILSLWGDERYPPLLRTIHDPPALLYVRGHLPEPDGFAMVGSRRATAASLRFTENLAADLAARDIPIVSGLARGIDSAAHGGALRSEGLTVAVLGCGIDRVYPPENSRLFHAILEQGAVLTEHAPGTPPLAGHFPGRNRIISGLSRGVLVVEAAEGSGSLITVDFALEQGREVFAVPGAVHAPTSAGTNRLIKEGARVVTEAADILEVLWPGTPTRQARQQDDSFAASLDEPAGKVFRLLAAEPLHIDELSRKCGLTLMDLSAILLHLELRGGVTQLPGMRYIRAVRD